MYVPKASHAGAQAQSWRLRRPEDAARMQRLAAQPVAAWFGDWNRDVRWDVRNLVVAARFARSLPVLVLYNIPDRDCGNHSAGGVDGAAGYRAWIHDVAVGLGRGPAVVILEPDALGLQGDCLDQAQQHERLELLRDAVIALSSATGAAIYIDAGNAAWHPPDVMAKRLEAAGIAHARGFALNVSNYISTWESVDYGRRIAARVGGKPFVVDTSRNGVGPTADHAWCNPEGRAVGIEPTMRTGDPMVDAYVWVKVPGQSDGACNGGPAAGQWWPQKALELTINAGW
jgi:endoglucanase